MTTLERMKKIYALVEEYDNEAMVTHEYQKGKMYIRIEGKITEQQEKRIQDVAKEEFGNVMCFAVEE